MNPVHVVMLWVLIIGCALYAVVWFIQRTDEQPLTPTQQAVGCVFLIALWIKFCYTPCPGYG